MCVLCTVISFANGGLWDSLVNVDRQDNGDGKVGVHLPFIYWMDLNRNKQGPKLDISVLGGLVKVNVDRHNNPGKRPVMVRLLGQKVYNSYPKGQMPTTGQLFTSSSYQGEETKVAVKPDATYIKPDVIYKKPNATYVKPSDNVIAQESVVTESKVYESSSVANDVPATDSSANKVVLS